LTGGALTTAPPTSPVVRAHQVAEAVARLPGDHVDNVGCRYQVAIGALPPGDRDLARGVVLLLVAATVAGMISVNVGITATGSSGEP
jgi:hypothetical protein